MDGILTAAKSIRTQRQDDNAETFLTAIKSTRTRTNGSDVESSNVQQSLPKSEQRSNRNASTAECVLQILRSKPGSDDLAAILIRLSSAKGLHTDSGEALSLSAPGPLQAQIISTLLNTIIPDFWPVLEERQRSIVVLCLRSVSGVNAVVTRLKLLCTQRAQGANDAAQKIQDLLDLAGRLFTGDIVLLQIWTSLHDSVKDAVKRRMAWTELVNLVGSGRVISTIAQAEDAVGSKVRGSFLAKGGEYASWLGKNLSGMIAGDPSFEEQNRAAAQVLAKSMSLGYPRQLLQGLFEKYFTANRHDRETPSNDMLLLLKDLPIHTKRILTEHLLRWLSTFSPNLEDSLHQEIMKAVSATSAFLSWIAKEQTIQQHLVTFLDDPNLASSISLATRRACLAFLATRDDEQLQSLLDTAMSSFSSPIFIEHSPIFQQESLAQTLLLTAGYLHRTTPIALFMIARSSNHMQGVSRRLDCSNLRARWLGMVVGTALSSLVDKPGSQMSFGTEDMETTEARWYIDLVRVDDSVGKLEDFVKLLQVTAKGQRSPRQPARSAATMPILNGKPVFGPPRPPVQTEVIGEKVTEILDSDSEEDEDGLKPYAKPDSDPEDSDEDATLVNRKKPKPPVYIRDLMSMLRDDKSHDRFQLGIKHAAALIRRKANFGREVKDHAEEILAILCNLQDPFETENFDELKLQALIAVLLSDVEVLAPWLCRQVFAGDYSLAQRCIMLSAIGLGGRELAGLKDQDDFNPVIPNTEFPSKRLPTHLHTTYSIPASATKRLEAASKEMEHALIHPLALQAADKSTAHLNAVKVRTFSSRMEVERTKRKPAPNQLAMIFGTAFFFPLANRYQQEIAAYGSASVFSSSPFVLVTFLKTLALLLHASGPATLGLPAITEEFWELLLSLRVAATSDVSVMHAVLFSLLTLLEVNTDQKRIAMECPKQLMETQRWADMVFERIGGADALNLKSEGEEAKVRTLAAGVLVKCREVVEAYQKQLVGYSFG